MISPVSHTLSALSVLCNVTSVPFNSLPLTSVYWYFLLRPFNSFLLFKFCHWILFHNIGINRVSKTQLNFTYCSARNSNPWWAYVTWGAMDTR